MLTISVSNRRLATPMKLRAGNEIGVDECKLRIGNPKIACDILALLLVRWLSG
jgi:hypothetical protein